MQSGGRKSNGSERRSRLQDVPVGLAEVVLAIIEAGFVVLVVVLVVDAIVVEVVIVVVVVVVVVVLGVV